MAERPDKPMQREVNVPGGAFASRARVAAHALFFNAWAVSFLDFTIRPKTLREVGFVRSLLVCPCVSGCCAGGHCGNDELADDGEHRNRKHP